MKAKIELSIILLVFFTKMVDAQDTSSEHLDSLVDDFVTELQVKNIDTICIFRDYCVGYYYSYNNEEDLCNDKDIVQTYILWLEQGKTFLTKKDNCFDYSTIEIDSVSLWNYFLKNQQYIEKEEVKRFNEHIVYENHKKVIVFDMIDHSCRQDFKMIINKRIIRKHFNESDLQEKQGNNINMNYSYNQNLKSKKMIDELKQLTRKVEDERRLSKTRR